MYTLKGNIKLIKDTQVISDSFKKREFVVTDNSGNYPQDILFQAVQDRVSMLDGMAAGDAVEVSFFLRGREWTNPKDNTVKYFNSLDAWKVEKDAASAPPPPAGAPMGMESENPAPAGAPSQPTAMDSPIGDSEDDDLPF